MPELFEVYRKKGPAEIFKKPESQEEKRPQFDDVDLDVDKLSEELKNHNESVWKFEKAIAEKIIDQEFARLKKANDGKEGSRDEEARIRTLEMAKIICEEDGLATDEAALTALAMLAEGNVRKSKAKK